MWVGHALGPRWVARWWKVASGEMEAKKKKKKKNSRNEVSVLRAARSLSRPRVSASHKHGGGGGAREFSRERASERAAVVARL